jgi:predicted histone-like DNA-binding protein
MAIFYRKIQRANPQDRTVTKWYPVLNSLGMVKSKEVARQMSDETTMNPKEAEIAVYELVKVAKRLLLSGYTVQLDDLGTFYLTANAKGADNESDVTAANVQGLNIRFRPAASFKAEIAKAEIKAAKV